jgi:uncharacterized repeat protein (TIGR01451 family)
MKRIFRVACLAILGLSIAGFATYVFAQTPPAGSPTVPTPAPAPVSMPGTPTLPSPVAPMLPTPVAPTTPNPVVVVPTGPAPVAPVAPGASDPIPLSPMPAAKADLPAPGGLTLPTPTTPGKPADLLPLPGGATPMPADKPIVLPGGPAAPVTLPGAVGDVKPVATAPAAMDDAAGATDGNPSGRQEPSVSLEWIGPAAAKVGQACDYSIIVRNICSIPVQQVMVRVRLPQGVTVAGTEPKAVTEENVLMWEVGTMLPKQERNLMVKMVSANKGDLNCQAWVTFTGSSAMRIRVREPKLLIKATAPEKVLVGDGCTFVLTVSNPGDYAAEQVKLHAELSEGLESTRGNKMDIDIGNLAAGETRSVQVLCATKTGGAQQCEAIAEADGGLKAIDKAAINVIMPQIKLEASGPKLRYLDRKAKFIVKVTNPGDAPASNVVVNDVIPPGFKFLTADNGGRHDFSTHTASWYLGEIGPGQSREVTMECLAVAKGEHHFAVTANASRGIKDAGDVATRVEGLSAIMLEMVDLEDPVEVGADTVYEIRITNTGSQTETDVKLVCTVPDKLQFKGATGPGAKFTQNGSEIVFESLPKLAPRADAIFRVTCKAVTPGVATFKARITSTLLVDGVTKEEATRVYAD